MSAPAAFLRRLAPALALGLISGASIAQEAPPPTPVTVVTVEPDERELSGDEDPGAERQDQSDPEQPPLVHARRPGRESAMLRAPGSWARAR